MRPIRKLMIGLGMIAPIYLQAQKELLQSYLPANAKAVIHINLPSLASKVNWQEFQQLGFFKQALDDAPADLQNVLKNPAASGINFFSGIYIAMLPGKDPTAKPGAVLFGQITDTAGFRTLMQKINPKGKMLTAGKMHFLASEKNAVGWTPEIFVIQLSKNKGEKPAEAPSAKTTDLLSKEQISQFQALLTPAVNPLTKDVKFSSAMKESGDIRFWVDRNKDLAKTKKNNKADEVLKMMNWGMMQNGNYMTGVVRFENGKMVTQMRTYMNPTMDSLYRVYPPKGLNMAPLKKLPDGQPLALISFNMSTDMIVAMFKESGVEKMLDSAAKKSAVKPLEVIQSLNGDLSIAVIKSNDVDEKDSVTQALKGMQVFITASVKNKARLEPFIAELKKPKTPETDEEGNEKKPGGPLGGMKPALLLNDSFFVVSLSSFAAEKFLASSANNEVTRIATPYANYSSLFSLDMKAILGFATQMSKKKPAGNDEETAKLIEVFDRLVFYGGEYQNGAALSAAELQFSNKDENSLKQFVSLIGLAMNMGLKGKKSSADAPEYHGEDVEGETDEEVKEVPPPPPPKPKSAPKKKIQ